MHDNGDHAMNRIPPPRTAADMTQSAEQCGSWSLSVTFRIVSRAQKIPLARESTPLRTNEQFQHRPYIHIQAYTVAYTLVTNTYAVPHPQALTKLSVQIHAVHKKENYGVGDDRV